MIHVDADVSRGDEPGRTVRFLVDSGAAYSVLPTTVWQALGLRPERALDFVLADGTTIRRDVSHCFFTYQNVRAPSPVVLGEPGDAALLGTITLESMALVLNPFDRTLRPMRSGSQPWRGDERRSVADAGYAFTWPAAPRPSTGWHRAAS